MNAYTHAKWHTAETYVQENIDVIQKLM